MYMPIQRRSFLQTSLGLRMLELGLRDYSEYFQQVTQGPSGAIEWSTLVDRLTVQETRFFRDPDALSFVEEFIRGITSSLIEHDESLEIWSVGCASGEEPYTLAMIAEQMLGSLGMSYSVTGTDISTIVLRKARSGRYPLRALERIPINFHSRPFLPSPKLKGHQEQVVAPRRREFHDDANDENKLIRFGKI